MEDLRQLACDFVTNKVSPEGLPMQAALALARGLDSPALRELAGLTRGDDVRDIRDLYIAAMDELGVEVPTAEAVHWDRVRFWAHRVLDGTVEPYEGAAHITNEYFRLDEPRQLQEIYILTLLREDDPSQPPGLESNIRSAARNIALGLSDQHV